MGPQPQRAPEGVQIHYERHRPEQTTLTELFQVAFLINSEDPFLRHT
jgi:hypothetical protein